MHDVQSQCIDEAPDTCILLALIDARCLTRLSLLHMLTALSPIHRRAEDFTILPYSSVDEFLLDCRERLSRAGMIVFNTGPACLCENEDNICSEIVRLKHELPDTPIAILSDCDYLCNIVTAFHHGIHGYILSSSDPRTVIQAFRLVISGGVYIPHNSLVEISKKTMGSIKYECRDDILIDPALLDSFTPRQLEVLQFLQQGKSNKVIAHKLGMQECTVKTHVREIMTKLKATNRTHAVFLMHQLVKGKI